METLATPMLPTRTPKARARIPVVPMPLVPPCTRKLSPAASRLRSEPVLRIVERNVLYQASHASAALLALAGCTTVPV